MILPDVNVLLYAFRKDSVRHSEYREWLQGTIEGDAAYAMSPQVLAAVVRVGTHPRIYRQPSTVSEALSFCEALTQPEHCQIVQPGSRHWDIFTGLCRRSRATGNLIQDAWFAALAIESACEWVTTDRDYARFPGLRWREPLESRS